MCRGIMERIRQSAVLVLLVVLLGSCYDDALRGASAARIGGGEQKTEVVHTKKYRSKAFTMRPGDVISRYDPAEMPQGKVALRSLNAEVVLEDGTPVPLYESYLHHWAFLKFYIKEGSGGMEEEDRILVYNDGPCAEGTGNPQWFGIGSETRHTNYTVPPPYGIVIGDKETVPEGYEEIWVLNAHAIDTRGAEDVRLCTECLCSAYNVTELPSFLKDDYKGGLYCCEDGAHCGVEEGFQGSKYERNIYLDYTVTWVEELEDVVPVKVYFLDVTDSRTSFEQKSICHVEYTVPQCAQGSNEEDCIHIKESYTYLPGGGDVIYAVAHQHMGGLGFSLHKEDGSSVCTSLPTYGQGTEVGDEKGYIVGMSSCYPEPGTVKLEFGEKLTMKSYYRNTDEHTGVMGLYYMMVAPDPLESKLQMHVNDVNEIALFAPVTILLAAVLLSAAPFLVYNTIKRGGVDYKIIPDVGGH